MVVRGCVSGNVSLADIKRTVAYNATLSLTELEVNKSKDLQNAIRCGWVEVIEDRGMIHRATVSNTVVQQKQEFDKEAMMDMAREMAKTMAAEMVKTNPDIQALAKEMAKEMAKEINLKQPMVLGVTKTEQTLEDEKVANLFIDVDDIGVKVNNENIGTVREEGIDLSSSLEKFKRFKKVKL